MTSFNWQFWKPVSRSNAGPSTRAARRIHLLQLVATSLGFAFTGPLFGQTVAFQNATATRSFLPDHSGTGRYAPAQAIDGIVEGDQGWALPAGGSSETFVVQTVTNIGFAGGTLLTFHLFQGGGLLTYPNYQLGRFRLSVTTDDRKTYADGQANEGRVTANWTILKPILYTAANGATLSLLSDNSLLVSGGPATTIDTTYTVTALTSLTNITGFRLEALTDPSLPGGGPGRSSIGNFELQEFQMTAVPAGLSLLGAWMKMDFRYPERTRLFTGAGAQPVTFTVSDSVEVPAFLTNPTFTVDASDTTIKIHGFRGYPGYPAKAGFSGTPDHASFNGPAFSISGRVVTRVSIDPVTTLAGLDQSRITLDANQIYVNWMDLKYDAATAVVLHVETEAQSGGTAGNTPPEALAITKKGNDSVTISWDGTGILQSKNLFGAWVDTPYTSSPVSWPTVLGNVVLFRVRSSGSMPRASPNVVGYVVTTIVPGFNLLANPLDSGWNVVANLFQGVPEGTQIYKFNGFFEVNGYSGGWWDMETQTLNPGEGCFVRLPGNSPFALTFVGEVQQGKVMTPLRRGFSLVSSAVPQTGTLTELQFPASDGDLVYRWNSSNQHYSSSGFDSEFGWNPSEPTIEVGEAFWLQSVNARSWERHFSMNP